MERPKTPTIVERPVHKRQSIIKPFPFSRTSCPAWVSTPSPRNNRQVVSMTTITTNSAPAIAAPTMPQGKPPSTCQNQGQKITTSLLATPLRTDVNGGSVPNNSCSQGYLRQTSHYPRPTHDRAFLLASEDTAVRSRLSANPRMGVRRRDSASSPKSR